MDKLCLHKFRSDKSDEAIGPELQNAQTSLIRINREFQKSCPD